MLNYVHLETWLSGRKRLTANEVGFKSPRRFESVRLRQKGNCKCELSASLRSAANLYGIFGEKETDLSIRAKEIF